MEVQAPQSVQINFNNKIITLHNVTIVKNPKIITIDASQYTNFLKGSPMKLNNVATTAPSIKLQMPTLIPANKAPVGQQTLSQKLVSSTVVLNHHPVLTPKLSSQVIRTIPKNIVAQLKTTPVSISSSSVIRSPVKLQTIAVKQHKPTTVIISPPKLSTPNLINPIKVQLKGHTSSSEAVFSYVISKPPKKLNSTPVLEPTSALQSTPVLLPIPLLQSTPTPEKAEITNTPTNKNKISPCDITPPDAKKHCKQLEFHCICCKEVFDNSNKLVDHIKIKHPEAIKPEKVKKLKRESSKRKYKKKLPLKTVKSEAEYEVKDDDESEVNDLIMDLEETQDTAFSNQDRSDTPESPEFEEHVPTVLAARPKPPPVEVTAVVQKAIDEELDYENYEYCSNIMEPICELSCEEDSNDGVQDENEAMRLYREAMEVNYQQNGIKKRGRRKQRKSKPLVENTTSLNGILAGLLENSTIKVPPGPGRGRRKEINEKELEMDRSNGICLFSCNK
jgi:hypothetical protein